MCFLGGFLFGLLFLFALSFFGWSSYEIFFSFGWCSEWRIIPI